MEIKVFTNQALNNANAYLIINPSFNEAILVDTADDASLINTYLLDHQLTLSDVLITHGHYDHVKGLDLILAQNKNASVWIHKKDSLHLYNARKNFSSKTTEAWEMEYSTRIRTFADDISLKMAGMNVNMRWRPGHTHGSAIYEIPEMKALFCGDVVFKQNDKISYADHRWLQAQTNPNGFREVVKEIDQKYDHWKIYPGHWDYGFSGLELKNLKDKK